MAWRVLLIDDDLRLAELLTSFLAQHDFVIGHARDGAIGLKMIGEQLWDAVLLDVMMPGVDGLEVCRRLRAKSQIPILMLTARGDETDRVVGLELGADDYVAKPFSPRELLARLRAVMRRAQPALAREVLSAQHVSVDLGARQVTANGNPVELTALEFDLLVALLKRAGRVIPRESLLAEAGRGDVVVSERTIDVHISHLRQKLFDDPPRLIKTVRGVGYVLTKE